jgi:hypothetical protein
MYFGRRPGALVADDVTATQIEPRYDGETLVAFGYAIDLERAGTAIDSVLLGPLYYTRRDLRRPASSSTRQERCTPGSLRGAGRPRRGDCHHP